MGDHIAACRTTAKINTARLLRSSALIAASLFMASCISVPTGTTRIYKAQEKTEGNVKKVVFSDNLFSNTVTPDVTIRKTPIGQDKSGAEVFAIYLSDGYFKYLKDMAGVNEVVVVAEFTETSAGTDADTITRILGPYFGVADKAHTPFLNKLIYGPKTLDSDHLNMKLTVIEYDQGENKNTAAFLDFIQSVTQTLSLSNPVTTSEQAFAKEIAKSLLSLNKDDVVMEIDLNFTSNAGDLQNQKGNGSYIPLNVGDYVLINKEHCAPANCFFLMTDNGNSYNPFAWVGDIALLIPTAMRRAWTDTPDNPSLGDITVEKLTYDKHSLAQKASDDANAKTTAYTDKTWLALSVVKGGDPSLWNKRKLLNQAEKAIQDLIKVRGGELAFSQNYQLAKQSLEDARRSEELSSSGVSFVSPVDSDGNFAPTANTGEYCLYHTRNLQSSSVVATFYRLDAYGVPQQLPATDIVKDSIKATPNNTCFKVAIAARTLGRYEMMVAYVVNKEVRTQKIRYSIDK